MSSSETRVRAVLEALAALELGEIRLMEICGTHTMAIARAGLKSMLPANIKLLSGPGCPVCVTPAEVIDAALELSMRENIIIASYGDMIRVPGSKQGDSLQRRRALGARVKIVYSPVDALEIAKNEPGREVVFLGVGFETTAPGTAAAVLTAKEEGIKNFSLFSMLKTVEPALRALMQKESFDVDGFICPGHVGSIIGERGFEYLPEEYSMPAVIAGFEAENILLAIYKLACQIASGQPRVENVYRRAVRYEGNTVARKMLESCFEKRTERWRGLGEIPGSGLALCRELEEYDAEKRFGISFSEPRPTVCRCGEVICGHIGPADCPMFGTGCTPEDPLGPCMVSSEGACAASYKYAGII